MEAQLETVVDKYLSITDVIEANRFLMNSVLDYSKVNNIDPKVVFKQVADILIQRNKVIYSTVFINEGSVDRADDIIFNNNQSNVQEEKVPVEVYRASIPSNVPANVSIPKSQRVYSFQDEMFVDMYDVLNKPVVYEGKELSFEEWKELFLKLYSEYNDLSEFKKILFKNKIINTQALVIMNGYIKE